MNAAEMEELPALPGSYALRLSLPEPICLQVGRLGAFSFPLGEYLYLGSAHGPGGLRGRLRHHTRAVEKPHWHLDFLRSRALLLGGWFALEESPGLLERRWSQALSALPGALIPAPGFGSADCHHGCASHLVAFPHGVDPALVEKALSLPGVALKDLSHPADCCAIRSPFSPLGGEGSGAE